MKRFLWSGITLISAFLALLVGFALGVYFLSNINNYARQKIIGLLTPSEQLSLTPTPEQNIEWTTYQDPKYHFTLEYPSHWKFQGSRDKTRGANPECVLFDNLLTEELQEDYNGYAGFSICFKPGKIPNIVYDSQSLKLNQTIKPYSLKDYSGIEVTQNHVDGKIIYLPNPSGGYIHITLKQILTDDTNTQLLNRILKSLTLPDPPHPLTWEMYTSQTTGIKFPRLTSYYNPTILKSVNSAIDELTGTLKCSPNSGSYDVKSQVTYTEKDIFSIYAHEGHYCGGPYPTNDNNISLTFDLKTGKTVDFKDLFKNYETNKQAILTAIFSQHPGPCEPSLYKQELERTDFAFHFSKEGLHVQPNFPHVAEACSQLVTVPFDNLKMFADPNNILARVVTN